MNHTFLQFEKLVLQKGGLTNGERGQVKEKSLQFFWEPLNSVYHLGSHYMLLLTNCEVHTGKYSDRSLDLGSNEVRSVRKTKVRIFSRMDRTNWSIRPLL